MNRFLKQIIKKIKFSLSLFIPGTFSQLRNKSNNDFNFDYVYILNDSIHQENIIEKNDRIIIDEPKIVNYENKISKKIKEKIKIIKNSVLVVLGFVVWFFQVKNVTQLPQVA